MRVNYLRFSPVKTGDMEESSEKYNKLIAVPVCQTAF